MKKTALLILVLISVNMTSQTYKLYAYQKKVEISNPLYKPGDYSQPRYTTYYDKSYAVFTIDSYSKTFTIDEDEVTKYKMENFSESSMRGKETIMYDKNGEKHNFHFGGLAGHTFLYIDGQEYWVNK